MKDILKEAIYQKAYKLYTGSMQDKNITRQDMIAIKKIERFIQDCISDMLITDNSELNKLIDRNFEYIFSRKEVS